MTLILNYRTLPESLNRLRLSKPRPEDSSSSDPSRNLKVYKSLLTHFDGNKHENLCFRVPSAILSNIDTESGTVTLSSNVFGFGHLETWIVDEISTRSAEFFNGKLFPRPKIQESFIPSVSSDNSLKVTANFNKLLIKDQTGATRKLSDLEPGTEVNAILYFRYLLYKKKSIQLCISVEALQFFFEEPKPVEPVEPEVDTILEPEFDSLCFESDNECHSEHTKNVGVQVEDKTSLNLEGAGIKTRKKRRSFTKKVLEKEDDEDCFF
jgi:hypothetical protein